MVVGFFMQRYGRVLWGFTVFKGGRDNDVDFFPCRYGVLAILI